MNVEFKIVTWENVKIPVGYEKQVKQGIIDGSINCYDDVVKVADEADAFPLAEKDRPFTLNENNGQSTIIIKNDNKVLFQNGQEFNLN